MQFNPAALIPKIHIMLRHLLTETLQEPVNRRYDHPEEYGGYRRYNYEPPVIFLHPEIKVSDFHGAAGPGHFFSAAAAGAGGPYMACFSDC